ncbi:GPP34 family phosphoprotein [Actinoplanes sp. NPDC049802]|uniref:GOLPH3/VPS74 family protein n=1 Tax=Actinoplanes sp. NPDC049802 TaxID=3154742 RepID=UPI0033EABA56
MHVPGSLPQCVYLLAHDPGKGRVRWGTELGLMLRAAALADLFASGHLTDERGRAVAVEGRRPCDDPVLEALRQEVAGSRPRRWQHWIGHRQRAMVKAVRAQLGGDGWVRLQPYRILGLFPATRVTIRDPRVRKALLGRVGDALRKPVGRVDPADAALVAVIAGGGLGLVLDRKARRAHKRRIKELTELSGPVGAALRAAIREAALGEGAV